MSNTFGARIRFLGTLLTSALLYAPRLSYGELVRPSIIGQINCRPAVAPDAIARTALTLEAGSKVGRNPRWPPLTARRVDLFDDAERAFSEFVDSYRDAKKLTIDEEKRLVAAICDAEEEERKSVASEASTRVRDKVGDSIDKLQAKRDKALELLGKVLNDTSLRSRHDKAKEYDQRARDLWESIVKMTKSPRGANHPVVAYMLETGQTQHRNYQQSSSNCTVYEWRTSAGVADCIYADGTTAFVVEIKPDNSRAIAKGREQVSRYVAALNNDPSQLQELIKKDSRFKDVKAFVGRLMLYQLCPEITDDGDFKEVSVSWRGER
jgi:hypothetical protein